MGELTSCFILGAKAPSANIDFLFFSVYDNCSSMDVGQPLPLSMFLRMAYIMSKLSPFTANITFHKRFFTSCLLQQ